MHGNRKKIWRNGCFCKSLLIDYGNYYFQLFNGENIDLENSTPIWGPQYGNNVGSNIIIDIPLPAGLYTLALYSPSGLDADFDGIGDEPHCYTTQTSFTTK